MNYTIKHITTEQELNKALAFDKKIFTPKNESSEYSRESWLGCYTQMEFGKKFKKYL